MDYLISMAVGLVIGLLVGSIVGVSSERICWRNHLIELSYAEYQVDKTTGQINFHIKTLEEIKAEPEKQ